MDPMSPVITSGTVTPKRRIIANQTAELITLQHKYNKLEEVGKRYETQKKLLDDALKAKHALQEIFFNTSQEKRELESINKHLDEVINEKDYILKECKDDNELEIDSIKRLNELQVTSLKRKCSALRAKNECYMDVIDVKHDFKCGLSDIKYDTLSTKYKLIKSENTVLKKQLKLFKSQFHLKQKDNCILHKYEPIIVELLEEIQHFQTELNTKQKLLTQLKRNDEVIRNMYKELKSICSQQNTKINRIIAKNNKLNTIIEQNDVQNEKMQKHFQHDIASKERTIVKLETKLERIASTSNLNQNTSDALKEQHEVFKEQLLSIKNEKKLLKQEIQHIEDKLKNKDDYIQTLKKQIADNNENISRLHEVQSESDAKYKTLNDRYHGNLGKLQKLADKLKQQIDSKKRFKKQYVEAKTQLNDVLKDNERIEKETDKQSDAVQQTLEQYKQKVLKKNKEIQELEESLNQIEAENRQQQQQVLLLQKDNENQQFLIEHLEIDNNEQSKLAQKAREIRHKNRSVFNQIMSENHDSQNECHEILDEIEKEEDEDEDDDIDLNPSNVREMSGNKRQRNDIIDEKACDEPPRKKTRHNHNKSVDDTPFKGNKKIFKNRKRKNRKKSKDLPNPIIH